MTNEFSGKTAFVTGASRGIGAATAIALSRRGLSRVVLHYNSYRPGAEEVAATVREAGAETELIQANLGEWTGIEQCIAELREKAPEVDILINNAGALVGRAALPESTPKLFDTVMNLNVKSVWFLSQAVVPYMLENSSGVILNVSSIAARNGGGPGATLYSAAKAAISAMTKGMAKELSPRGIRVNALSPGTVDNYFHEQFTSEEALRKMTESTPLGRLGTNEDLADVAVFLCSNDARYMIGQTVEVNGGMYMN